MKKVMASVVLGLFVLSVLWAMPVNALFDFVTIAAPANPSAGSARVYVNSSTSLVSCLNSDGTTCFGTAWTGLTYSNGWTDFGGGFQNGVFSKNVSGQVYLQGLLACGTATANVLMFTLPAGSRPSSTAILTMIADGIVPRRVDVSSGGEARLQTTGACTYMTITGQSFSTVP